MRRFFFLPSWGNSEGPVSPEAPNASWPAWHSDLEDGEEGKHAAYLCHMIFGEFSAIYINVSNDIGVLFGLGDV